MVTVKSHVLILLKDVDFNESFAPIINDVSFRIMLIVKLIWKLQASIINVETAFLHGDLQEDMYMTIPEGMESNNNACALLNKTIYGLCISLRKTLIRRRMSGM